MSEVRVLPTSLVVGGWRGELTIAGDVITVVSDDGEKTVTIDVRQLRRTGFSSNNGLWVFTLADGKKVRIQSAGVLLSADRSDAGRETNTRIRDLCAKHGIKGMRI